MQHLRSTRILVDRALDKLEGSPPDHPLRRLDPVERRRLLAEAAFRELRELQREIAGDEPRSD